MTIVFNDLDAVQNAPNTRLNYSEDAPKIVSRIRFLIGIHEFYLLIGQRCAYRLYYFFKL